MVYLKKLEPEHEIAPPWKLRRKIINILSSIHARPKITQARWFLDKFFFYREWYSKYNHVVVMSSTTITNILSFVFLAASLWQNQLNSTTLTYVPSYRDLCSSIWLSSNGPLLTGRWGTSPSSRKSLKSDALNAVLKAG